MLLKQLVFAVFLLLVVANNPVRAAEAPAPVSAKFDFEPLDENRVPEQFRMDGRAAIPFESRPVPTSSKAFQVSEITFPSPVVTPHEANNTVHCEYFCPTGEAKHPGVIVLHILGGDFELSRFFCRGLATRGCSALFVKMPYYGPRRVKGSDARMVSKDPRQTVSGMTQAVKDIRYATAWLADRKEIDANQLGIMGISLGGITGALALTAEPRLGKACLLLAGGDIAQVAWSSKEMRQLRDSWEADGGTQETFAALMRSVDPVAYGSYVKDRKILMLNARHDEVIPPVCSEALWKAFGEPQIVWWDAGHYTAARYIFEGLDKTTRFFAPQPVKQ